MNDENVDSGDDLGERSPESFVRENQELTILLAVPNATILIVGISGGKR